MEEHIYEVSVDWKDTRRGTLHAEGIDADVEVVTPPEFAKGIEGKWSPEHLFVAAVNSCLMTTFLAIAENSKLEFVHFESKAYGRLEKPEGKYMMTEITLMPMLTIAHEADRARAERILQKAEAACLISNSIKSSIIFKPEIRS